MDEGIVREHAEAHGRAVVSGDLRAAGSDLTTEAQGGAPAIMGQLPSPLTGAEVLKIVGQGSEFVAHIKYSGPSDEKTVLSTWAESDGRPKITALTIAE